MTYKKKLIEVALPLEAINKESAREKSIRHGHPSTLHLWWARRPLASCRAVLFASLVDDPSSRPDKFATKDAQKAERERLFRIIEALVKWENINNQEVLNSARAEIQESTGGKPPRILDPFCGGGSIPLEAQRLGLEAHASDLNPVAVLITKALIEIPPKFANRSPVNPESRSKMGTDVWRGAQGLADDVKHYGEWMRDEAERRIGHMYPNVQLDKEQGGGDATVIAWLWARTVRCPNPGCGAQLPLVRSFWLSKKPGHQAWVDLEIDRTEKTVQFDVRTGLGTPPSGTVDRRGARCVVCTLPVPLAHVRTEAKAGRMSARLMAIVAEGNRQRVYVSPDSQNEQTAEPPVSQDFLSSNLPERALGFRVQQYGMTKHSDLFNVRQLVALKTLSDLISETRDHVFKDALDARDLDDGQPLHSGGLGATAYADAVATYLGVSVSKMTMFHNTLARWRPGEGKSAPAFGRQAIPMVWDYAEVNPFAGAGGDWSGVVSGTVSVLSKLPAGPAGTVMQLDATKTIGADDSLVICTDPPYYDNIGYADLADFFFVWLRRGLGEIFPSIFSTLLTPKKEELVATPYRFGGDKSQAESFFEQGLRSAFLRIHESQHSEYPFTIFYAFKQTETVDDDSGGSLSAISTGWESMLEALLSSGFAITGTWPSRTEGATRLVAMGTNALASSILLVCRPRPADAPLATRKEFLAALRAELPEALRLLQQGNIAPVDLAQASIGPGMSVFSRYSKVLEADGTAMRVRTALGIINQVLDEVLAEQESEYDNPTRWAVAWFEQHGMHEGPFGDAETLSKAKNTSIQGMEDDGVLVGASGKVKLLSRTELQEEWDPTADRRLTLWEVGQHLVRAHEREGESAAAALLRKVGPQMGAAAKDLAYRLFTISDRKKRAAEAHPYNALVVAWPEIVRLASKDPSGQSTMEI